MGLGHQVQTKWKRLKRFPDFLRRWLIAKIIMSVSYLYGTCRCLSQTSIYISLFLKYLPRGMLKFFFWRPTWIPLVKFLLTFRWNRSFSKRLFIFTLDCMSLPFFPSLFDFDNPPSFPLFFHFLFNLSFFRSRWSCKLCGAEVCARGNRTARNVPRK